MEENARLSELTGIAETDDSGTSFWPVNLALLSVGAAITAVSFLFLDAGDPRVTHNPWTYAIATPVALLVLSVVLSSFVSRVVEKSMQLAFLLSVLIHILLLAYAVNIVIFSRMWPDIMESLTREKHQLQREALQAKQYVRFTNSPKSGRKPDYLRHVPTIHQPSETNEAQSQAITLAESERADLASPSPELKPSDTAHLTERAVPQNTTQAFAPSMASLARSDIRSPETPTRNIPLPATQMERSKPSPLAPSESNLARADSSRSAGATSPALPSPDTALARRATPSPMRREVSSAVSPVLQPAAKLPLRQPTPKIATNSSAIPVPRTPSSSPSADSSLAPQMSRLQKQSSSAQSSLAMPSAISSAETTSRLPPRASIAPRSSVARGESSTATAGQQAMRLPRSEAGGVPSTSSQLSMPIQGPQLLADNQPQSRLAPSVVDRRLRGQRRGATGDTGPALPQSPTSSGLPSLGATGTGASASARASAEGDALAADVADLSGAARDIQRASLAAPGQSGSASSVESLSTSDPSDNSFPAPGTADQIAANVGSERRQTDSGAAASIAPSNASAVPQPDFSASLPSRENRSGAQRPTDSIASDNASTPGFARTLGAAPDGLSSGVSLDGIDDSLAQASDATGSASAITAADSQLSQQRRSDSVAPASTVLQIDAPSGVAGLELQPNKLGPLLARRSDRETPNPIAQIEAQRFQRQQIGGELAGGQRTAVPKPAFQQRIDRLEDRTPRDESSIDPQTELAIERGLGFLQRTQGEDGSWRLQDYDTKLLMRSDTAATGLALLAFQGAGYTHQKFKFADTVRRGTEFLIKNQKPDGDLYIPQNPASDQNAWLYSHGIAALALCEAYGMTQDPMLRAPAQKSIDFMAAAQDPDKGGWRYRPGLGADTSVSGWFLMALKSGQLAGLDVPEKTMRGIEDYLEASQVSERQDHLYRYNPYALNNAQQGHGLKPTAVMTSVGLLMRLYTGWDRNLPSMQAGADVLLRYPPEHGTAERSRRDTYYWYYATQVMFHMQGKHWKQWHDKLYPLLIDHQVTSGDMMGSWNPVSPTPDLWARYGGRLYVTTMNLLSLEVSYRHLPLYEAAAQ
ncbi:MAG: hypothetical protein Aurels2KO_23100 [Aureliella sp.]